MGNTLLLLLGILIGLGAIIVFTMNLAGRRTHERVERAALLLLEGRTEEAEALIEGLELAPALRLRAQILMDRGRLQESESVLRRAIARDPDWAPAWNTLGLALEAARNHVGAEEAFREAIARDSSCSDALNNLGALQCREGKFVKALESFRKAAAVDQRDCLSWRNLGNLLAMMDLFTDARAAFARALDIAPDDPRTLYWLAATDLAAGDPARAASLLERAVTLQPHFARARYHLAMCLERMGRSEEAQRERLTALKDDPYMEAA